MHPGRGQLVPNYILYIYIVCSVLFAKIEFALGKCIQNMIEDDVIGWIFECVNYA